MQRNPFAVSLIALFVFASVSAFGEKGRVKGIIISRTGETLIVTSGGEKVTVVLTDDTTTKDDKGLFGLNKQKLSNIVLIPGLKVDVEGASNDQGRIVAKTITVDGDDLETAEMIQAGLHPTEQQVATNMQNISTNKGQAAANKQNIAANKDSIDANKYNIAANKGTIETNEQNIAAHHQLIAKNISEIEENTNRFTALSEYDVKGEATVLFNVGSTTISSKDQQELKNVAQTASALTGYIIEVMGYADSSGNAAMNTKLSEDRAKAVVTYLIQQGNVPVRHIVAPGAMGEYGPAASNETKSGRAENRRVVAKILVNKGIAGQ